MALIRQHLIDPEVCIRCNTCEETCPIGAITHNDDNYVVNYDVCDGRGDCMIPCPTGAVTAMRLTDRIYSTEEQLTWEDLPEDVLDDGQAHAADGDALALQKAAHSGEGAGVVPPASAPAAKENLYGASTPATATVTGNMRLTDDGKETDIRHIVLDFGKTAFPWVEGQSIGITPPGTDAKGKKHHMRLYTIASPRDGERPGYNNLALTVKRVTADDADNGQPGIASNYLCDLKRGDTVQVTGPYGGTFLMPDDPATNIIMICTGTGAAAFRAMTERRRRHQPDAPGTVLLFFGARTRGELPYFGPLKKLPKSLIDVEMALSREPGEEKQYVQDRMRARATDIARLLHDEKTHVFICGLKGMETGCADAFADICADAGIDWAIASDRMRSEGRYHVETY
ncbi:MAG: benzoyl-CoA 2,3-epoxidase subunit BoxA [Rhodospirillales bacterium]|nr:benzoyl-CoA 2,3-epoxidase subunit BoxA [Rhodospirillales bacterium]